jgi:hypothetical protein
MAKYIERIREFDCYQLTQQVYNAIINRNFTHSRVVILPGDEINIVTNNGLVPIDIGQWLVVDNLNNAVVMENEAFNALYMPKP